MKPIDKLISLLRDDKIIPVIGAGVSYAAAGLPGWKGFIENGLQYADDRKLDRGSEIKDAKEFLEKGKLIQGANIMKTLLNAPDHPFADWLDDFLGNPKIKSDELLNSINNLCTPIILTTNYDTLLYSTTKIKTKKIFDWSQHEDTARALKKHHEFLLHLHGVYDRPKTIILSADDYKTLNRQLGYKSILKDLWTNYHFLFIGSSRDGVMDEDFSTVIKFLNKWFPGVPNEHFILLQENDIAKGLHIELAKTCNIGAISYGTDYNALPGFINNFNPNWEKANNKTLELQKDIKKQFETQLVLSSGKLTADTSKIKTFIKDTLPNGIYWIDSVQANFLEKMWNEFNQQIKSKKEKFASYQNLVKGLVSLSDIDARIIFWSRNRDNPSALNTKAFINLAILAYECLNKFPKEILEDIRHRSPHAIHPYYFDGYLGRFIREYKMVEKLALIDVNEFYSDDKYFFENLKRILTSLQSVLELNPDHLYKEIPPALITPEIKIPYLVFISSKEISLRRVSLPYQIFAKLTAEESLPFKDAQYLQYKSNTIIIGYTSKNCFYWNPKENLTAVSFFEGNVMTAITQVFSRIENAEIETQIFCGNEIILFTNFKKITEVKLQPRLNEYVYFPQKSCWIGKKTVYNRQVGPFLFGITQKENKTESILKVEDLWALVKDLPTVKERLKKEMYQDGLQDEKSHLLFPFVNDVYIQQAKWSDEEILLLSCHVSFHYSRFTIIFGFNLNGNKLSTLFRVCLVDIFCIAYSLINNNSNKDLVCGYLSTGNFPNKLVQYFPAVNINNDILADNAEAMIDSDGYATSDILSVCALPNKNALAMQDKKVFHLNFENFTYSEYKVDSLIKNIISVT